jgi:hypothetical protein
MLLHLREDTKIFEAHCFMISHLCLSKRKQFLRNKNDHYSGYRCMTLYNQVLSDTVNV